MYTVQVTQAGAQVGSGTAGTLEAAIALASKIYEGLDYFKQPGLVEVRDGVITYWSRNWA